MYYLPARGEPFFPHPFLANDDGLLAVGGRVEPDWLLLAYRFGIFPWYHQGEEILWWSLAPRMVLFPSQIKVAKSMKPYFNQKKFEVTMDQAFAKVMERCALVRRAGQSGTWIHSAIFRSFIILHEMGYAHSVEVWQDEQLVGGLYGLSIGKVFFGESMFADVSNASKFGFIHLAKYLESQGYVLIDCQQDTAHLRSLGAELMAKETFLGYLKENVLRSDQAGKWQDWQPNML